MTCLLYCRFRSQGTKGNKYSWDLFDEELLKWSAEANLVDFPSGSQKILKYTQIFLLPFEGEGEVTQSLPSSGEEKAEFGTSLVRTSHLWRNS